MRSEEVEEAIKVLDKYKIRLLQTRKEIGLVEDFKNHHTEKQYNRCGKRAKSIETVLSYIEKLEKMIPTPSNEVPVEYQTSIYVDKRDYVSKQVIRDKIKELEENGYWEYLEQRDLEKTISILKSIIGE